MCARANHHMSAVVICWCPLTFNFLAVLCYKNHHKDVKLRACASWVCIQAQVMPPPCLSFFCLLPCHKMKHRWGQKWRKGEGYREGRRLWIGRVSGMHGQPLCLSKTLQQLHVRDKSNHSQPTPPFPPPTHKHFFPFPLCRLTTHTHTHN